MSSTVREDDFATRRQHLREMSDDELHAYFWSLTEQLTAPLIETARTHTSASIERSVLLRMGFSSVEAKSLVDAFSERGLLGRGVGRLILAFAQASDSAVREAGAALLRGEGWEALPS